MHGLADRDRMVFSFISRISNDTGRNTGQNHAIAAECWDCSDHRWRWRRVANYILLIGRQIDYALTTIFQNDSVRDKWLENVL